MNVVHACLSFSMFHNIFQIPRRVSVNISDQSFELAAVCTDTRSFQQGRCDDDTACPALRFNFHQLTNSPTNCF